MNDLFGWISPDINIIFPSFDVIGALWRCILRPIFMPQNQASSPTKSANFVAPKIIKTSSAFRQPLSTLYDKKNLVRKNNNFQSRPVPSQIFITKRLNRNTEGIIGRTIFDAYK